MADRQSAACNQTGEPVPPSGPVLGNAPTPLQTADRRSAACLSYPSQLKTGQELEGGALIGGIAAVPLTSLVNKRVIATELASCTRDAELDLRAGQKLRSYLDTHTELGRKKGCGAWTVQGTSLDEKTRRFIRLNCKCWDCRYCGPRNAKRYRRAIGIWAERHGLNRFLTLTLDPKKLNGQDSTKYLKRTWAKLRTYLHRKYGKSLTYISVLEYQKNGNAHLHVLLNKRIEYVWLKEKWQAIGGGWNVFIKLVSIRNVVNYVSKYLSKELLLSAPKRARRVTTSRDIKLFEKGSPDTLWTLIKVPIERIRHGFSTVTSEAFSEIDGLLNQFIVIEISI